MTPLIQRLWMLGLAARLGLSCLGSEPAPATASRSEPFPVIPPVADAAPSIRHPVLVGVPATMQLVRQGDSLAVSFPTRETTNLMVGQKLVTGIMREDAINQNGSEQPCGMSLHGGSLDFDFSTNVVTLKREHLAARERLVYEHRVTLFETDVPAQHMWSPQSGKYYRVLWTRTFKAQVEANDATQALVGIWDSIETGGRDIGERITRMQYIFRTNTTFSVSARMKDGEEMRYGGKYTVNSNKLRLEIPELGSNDLPYSLTNRILKIRDPELDSWVKFKKRAQP